MQPEGYPISHVTNVTLVAFSQFVLMMACFRSAIGRDYLYFYNFMDQLFWYPILI